MRKGDTDSNCHEYVSAAFTPESRPLAWSHTDRAVGDIPTSRERKAVRILRGNLPASKKCFAHKSNMMLDTLRIRCLPKRSNGFDELSILFVDVQNVGKMPIEICLVPSVALFQFTMPK